MRLALSPSRRAGFSLIELLVVISILALMTAMVVAGLNLVRAGQYARTTDDTVKKAQVAVNVQLAAVRDDATKPGNPHLQLLIAYGDNDPDRGKALTTYAYAKRAFPQSFAQALNPLPGLPISLGADNAFKGLPAVSGLTPEQESAVILYRIVTSKAGRGMASTEEAFAGATTTVKSAANVDYTVLKDGYGSPIALKRWYGANPATDPDYSELQSPPYVNPSDGSKDPFDPLGRLRLWSNPTSRSAALVILNAGGPLVDFDGRNKVITVVSAGADKVFNTGDDVYGFRLARFGGRGD